MQSSLYVAISAQVALQSRLEAIAQNVANTTTPGYRANEMKFDSVLSMASDTPVSFVSSGSKVIKQSPGDIVKTGNAFDVAIKGNGWLSVSTAAGQVYTRDGRLRMTSEANSSPCGAIRFSTRAAHRFSSTRARERRPSSTTGP